MTLSIITINYNNRDGLQKTIDSVLAQTWTDFEWIVIDGGSTDGSKELIEQYQERFTYWCSEPDNGVYNAMNKGIAKARGEYLLFLNSGDYLYNGGVLESIQEGGLDKAIVSGQTIRMDNGKYQRIYNPNIVIQLFLNTLNHQSTFIKRELFNGFHYREDYKIVSDWIAWIEWIIIRNYSYKYTDIIVAIQETTGISHIQYDLMSEERRKALKELFGNRLAETLPTLCYESDLPYVKKMTYLSHHAPRLFLFLHRTIAVMVMIHDFIFRKTSYR